MTSLVERLYYHVRRIRRVEETIAAIYPTDAIKSPVHLSIGQEAVSVGVTAALQPGDRAFGSYRCHALYLAMGGDLGAMMAELYGKAAGCCGGWGGSMHLVDPERGLVATSAVVGSTVPLAVGYAYAETLRGRPTVVASFFGDGAMEEGAVHEAMNFAALHRLPVLFVCENNGLAIHVPIEKRQATWPVEVARGVGIPSVSSASYREGADASHIWSEATNAIAALRAGRGPCFLACAVHRWREHVGPGEDWHLGYREKPAKMPDPVEVAGASVESGRRAEIDASIEAEIAEAVRFAEQSPLPTGHDVVKSGGDS